MIGPSSALRRQLVDADSGRTVVDRLELATTFWQRLRGWQMRAIPAPGTGLLIAPCRSVHTFWMRFSIDVMFLAEDGTIIRVVSDAAPWRIVTPVRAAHAVLEMPTGRCMLKEGQRLKLVHPPDDPLPRSLKFLC